MGGLIEKVAADLEAGLNKWNNQVAGDMEGACGAAYQDAYLELARIAVTSVKDDKFADAFLGGLKEMLKRLPGDLTVDELLAAVSQTTKEDLLECANPSQS